VHAVEVPDRGDAPARQVGLFQRIGKNDHRANSATGEGEGRKAARSSAMRNEGAGGPTCSQDM
jgi:hypothetical protein